MEGRQASHGSFSEDGAQSKAEDSPEADQMKPRDKPLYPTPHKIPGVGAIFFGSRVVALADSEVRKLLKLAKKKGK